MVNPFSLLWKTVLCQVHRIVFTPYAVSRRLTAKLQSLLSFVRSEIMEQEEEVIKKAIAVSDGNKHFLQNVLRDKAHRLHPEAERVSILDPDRPAPYEEMTLRVSPEHTRAFLKIQDGCNQFCSYCKKQWIDESVDCPYSSCRIHIVKSLRSSKVILQQPYKSHNCFCTATGIFGSYGILGIPDGLHL